MDYSDFTSKFKKQIASIPIKKQFVLALTICKNLYADYQNFVMVHNWGDTDLLMDAIRLCEKTNLVAIDKVKIQETILKIDSIIPDTEDFGDEIGSYGLNASAAVYETLQFLLDNDSMHIYNIGTYLTDTIDFKIQEKKNLSENEIDNHPLMVGARNFLLTD